THSAATSPVVATPGVEGRSVEPGAATPPVLAAIDTRTASRADAETIAPDLSEDPEFYLWLGDMRPADAE
ncbi:hypothetical protein, partial [Cognatilysobacter lacus]|uniref:hypothetical protein n=1 Tax=Cognatilysobacter lacus TaxID=1643323 RepID=UPI00165996E7